MFHIYFFHNIQVFYRWKNGHKIRSEQSLSWSIDQQLGHWNSNKLFVSVDVVNFLFSHPFPQRGAMINLHHLFCTPQCYSPMNYNSSYNVSSQCSPQGFWAWANATKFHQIGGQNYQEKAAFLLIIKKSVEPSFRCTGPFF